MATPTHPEPNFTSYYAVLLDRPLSETFPILAERDGFERVTRLSSLCTEFELLKTDTVALSPSTSLSQSSVRTLQGYEASETQEEQVRVLPRQFFKLVETVPIFFGLFKSRVEITGTLTWDEEARVALYESVTNHGIVVWKLRELEELEEGGKQRTRVKETIKGRCPGWMRFIVQREADKGHRCGFSTYHEFH